MRYTIRPLTDFTAFTTSKPKPNPFRASWSDTLELLDKELTHLRAQDVIFEVAVQHGDIRLDGMLRANAKVTFHGVRLSFQSTHGPLSYPCDTYVGRWYGDPPDWQINLRAIAKGLEALRAVDRYGVTRRGEQYTGWKALPPGSTDGAAVPVGGMTKDQAYEVLRNATGIPDLQVSDQGLIRIAKRAAHPDRNGGERTLWDEVERAAAVIERTGS